MLYPCDAVSTERLVVEMAQHKGMAYMRTSRPKTPVTYGPDETFPIGGSKVLRQSANDVAAVVGAGVTVFEALKAYDQLKAEGIAIRVIDAYSVQPIDAATLIGGREGDTAARSSPSRITMRPAGSAMRSARRVAPAGFAVRRLAVREIPRSGQPDELIDATASRPGTSSTR